MVGGLHIAAGERHIVEEEGLHTAEVEALRMTVAGDIVVVGVGHIEVAGRTAVYNKLVYCSRICWKLNAERQLGTTCAINKCGKLTYGGGAP